MRAYPLLAGLLLLCPLAHAEQATSEVGQARQLHDEGIEHYRAGRYSEAAERFVEAQSRVPTPANLYNLARCYEQLGRIDEALEAIDAYLQEATVLSDRRARANQLRARLRAIPARIEVVTEPAGGRVTINGNPAPGAPITPAMIEVEAGFHRVGAVLDGFEMAERFMEVRPGSSQQLELTLTPVPTAEEAPPVNPTDSLEPEDEEPPPLSPPTPRARNRPRWAWALLGVGLGLAVTAGGFDIAALVQSRRTEQLPSIGSYQSWRDRVRAFAITGDVLLSVGLTTAAAAIIWLAIDSRP